METHDVEITCLPQPEATAKALRTWIESHYPDNAPVVSIRIRHSVKIEFDPAIPADHYARLHEILSACCQNICMQENVLVIPWEDLRESLWQAVQPKIVAAPLLVAPVVMESTVVEITPDIFVRAKESLQAHYACKLKLSYLFYDLEPIPIDQAPQLVLVKEEEQKEKERSTLEGRRKTDEETIDEEAGSSKKAEWRDERLVSFEDLHKPKEPVDLKKLFTTEIKDKHSQPAKRFLIVGRAGIGKTTLSKYITCKYAELWGQKFEWVFYIPLRNLTEEYGKKNKKRELKIDLAKVISCECFSDDGTVTEAHIQHILRSDKVLLILDGYDELSNTIPESTLTELLNYQHVILTSRPYSLPDWRGYDYAQLENMGFSNEAINEYAQKFFTAVKRSDYTQPFLQFLRQNPAAWGIAHIPINLELICSLCEEKRTNGKEIVTPFTLTSLYQDIVFKLLKRYLTKRERCTVSERELHTWVDSRVYQSTSQIVDFLEELAFRTIQLSEGNIIISSKDIIKPLIEGFTTAHPDFVFKDILEAQLLKGTGTQKALADQDYYFIHLTFQEFFAASAIARRLKQTCTLTAVSENDEQMRQLILMYRYNPRFQLVWQFVSGILSDDVRTLKRFFDILRTEPQDLLGNYSRYLLVHCLAECKEPKTLQLSRYQVLNSLLIVLRNKDQNVRSIALRVLGNLGVAVATEEVLTVLINMLRDEEWRVRSATAHTLGNLGAAAATKKVLTALVNMLRDKDGHVRSAAADALGNLGTVTATEEVLIALVSMLQDEDRNVRSAAARALGNLCTAAATEEVLIALVSALRDEDWEVRYDAVGALKNLGTAAATEKVLIALVNALRDENSDVKFAAVDVLGKFGAAAATEEVLIALINMLRNKDEHVRSAVADALGNLGAAVATEEVLIALVSALRDKDLKVRYAAADILEKLDAATVTEEVLIALVSMLRDENGYVRWAAARALGNLGAAAATEEVLIALVSALRDDVDRNVKSAAADALGNLGAAAATEEVLIALVSALRDDVDRNVKSAAADALRKMGTIAATEEVLIALVNALGDEDSDVKFVVADALGKLGTAAATEEVLTVLINMLRDKDWHVRFAAISALGKLGAAAATEEVLIALVSTLRDKDWHVRFAAIGALEKLSAATVTEEVLITLVCMLRDEDVSVREAAVDALTSMGAAVVTEKVLIALVNMLQDENSDVRWSAADALGNLGAAAATEEVLIALVSMLHEKNRYVRKTAARALGKLGAAAVTEKVLIALVNMLRDEDSNVRFSALRALEKLGAAAATEEVLIALVSMLHEKNRYVRKTAARALGKLGTAAATEEVLIALVNMLRDEDRDVRKAAVDVLINLGAAAATEEVLIALVNALRDKDWHVRFSAADALGKLGIATATEEILILLVSALQDEDSDVKNGAIHALEKIGLAHDMTTFFNFLSQDSLPTEAIFAIAIALVYRFNEHRHAIFCHPVTHTISCWEKGILQQLTLPSKNYALLIYEIRKTWVEYIHLPLPTQPPLGFIPLHHVAAEGNIDRLQRLLIESSVDLDNQHNQFSLTPLMCAIRAGHVKSTEMLLNVGAAVHCVSSCERKRSGSREVLPGAQLETAVTLAAQHPDSATRCHLLSLFYARRQTVTVDEFENWLSNLSAEYVGAMEDEPHNQRLFSQEVGRWTAMGDLTPVLMRNSIRYQAHQTDMPLAIFRNPKKSIGMEVEMQHRFDPKEFLSLRIRLHVELLMRLTYSQLDTYISREQYPVVWLKAECLLMLETLYLYQESELIHDLYKKEALTKEQQDTLFSAIAQNCARKIAALQPGEWYEFLSGFTAHAAYVLVARVGDQWIGQINNLDDETEEPHHLKDATDSRKIYPYYLGSWQQSDLQTETFVTLVQYLLQAAFLPKAEALPLLYPAHTRHLQTKENIIERCRWIALAKQHMDNCVAYNHNANLFYRLLRRCDGNQEKTFAMQHHWFIDRELALLGSYYRQQGQAAPRLRASTREVVQTYRGGGGAAAPSDMELDSILSQKRNVGTTELFAGSAFSESLIEKSKQEAALNLLASPDESQQIMTAAILARKEESFYLRLRNAFEQWDIQTDKKLSLIDKKLESSAEAMQKQAQRFGYQCVDVKRDGRCFYYAFIAQLKKINPGTYGNLTVQQCIERIAYHLIEHHDFYEPFFRQIDAQDMNGFIDEMLQNTGRLWADNLIIQAATRAFNVNVVIVPNNGAGPAIFRRRDSMDTAFLGHEVEAHYQSLEHDPTIEAAEDLNHYIERGEFDEWRREAVDERRNVAMPMVGAPGAIGLLLPPVPAAAKGGALFATGDEEADAIQAAIQANAKYLNIDLRPQLRAPGAPGFMPPSSAAAKGAVAKGTVSIAAGAR